MSTATVTEAWQQVYDEILAKKTAIAAVRNSTEDNERNVGFILGLLGQQSAFDEALSIVAKHFFEAR